MSYGEDSDTIYAVMTGANHSGEEFTIISQIDLQGMPHCICIVYVLYMYHSINLYSFSQGSCVGDAELLVSNSSNFNCRRMSEHWNIHGFHMSKKGYRILLRSKDDSNVSIIVSNMTGNQFFGR